MKPWQGDVVLQPFGQEKTSDLDSQIAELQAQYRALPRGSHMVEDREPDYRGRDLVQKIWHLKELRRKLRPPTKMMASHQMSEFDFEDLP